MFPSGATRPFDHHAATAAPKLLPVQDLALTRLLYSVDISPVTVFESAAATGKTTVLKRLIDQVGGVRIDGRAIISATGQGAHAGIEEQLLRLLEDALARHDLVVIDDVDHLNALMSATPGYPRFGGFAALLLTVMDQVWDANKRLVLTHTSVSPNAPMTGWIPARVLTTRIGGLEVADFQAVFSSILGAASDQIDVDAVYEHACGLNIQQLVTFAKLARRVGRFDPNTLRTLLDTRILAANTRLEEVADISFSDLKGFDYIAEALTTFVLNPLRSDERLKGLDLRPKRGVLLYGPPGTGKTSVGRALARQMEGKFFLIDGSFSPEPGGQFFLRISQILAQAKRAAPCVLFIDDADVLFQSGYAPGFSRFFLSMLDGMESQTAGKIAVILTAMNPRHLPPALLRSGRVELWLETKAPDKAARGNIVAALIAGLPPALQSYDPDRVSALTEGFNAADMRRVVADVKALYARDVGNGGLIRPADSYFEQAAGNAQRNRTLLWRAASGGFDMHVPPASDRVGDGAARPAF